MAKEHLVITGSSGFVGSNLYHALKGSFRVTGLSRNPSPTTDELIDLTDAEKTLVLVSRLKPDIIIHCAALTNVEYCETHQEEARLNNVQATANILNAINKETYFIYLSTDYVYPGTDGTYTEESPVLPGSYYGQTKLEAEKLVRKQQEHALILRSTVIFGWDPHGHNFFMQLYRKQASKERMLVPSDQISNPTYIKTLVEVIRRSIDKGLEGTYNATGNVALDRYHFALRIADAFGWGTSFIHPVLTTDLGQVAQRPLNCSTVNALIQKRLGFSLPSLDKELDDLRSVIADINVKEAIP
ncbi:MAG: NAD(P)-dependent oxidoreductase [DPANN group archaeon]|nr:NAD(P)-dependent oxidoreductase [DPANN group archaeon]